MRSICACGDRPYHLDHIGNSVRVCNNDFLRLFFTEISEFLKHFIGSPEIKRRLISKVLIALSCLQYLTEYSVLRVFEMHVTGSDYRLSEPVTKLHYSTVEISQIFFTAYLAVSEQEHIIADRLYLKIIIERCDFLYLLLRFLFKYRPEKFACLTRTSYDKSLSVLRQQGFRYSRLFIEIIKVRCGNKSVQIFQTDLVLYKNYLVISRQLLYIHTSERRVEVAYIFKLCGLSCIVYYMHIYHAQHFCVRNRSVMVKVAQLEILCYSVELIVLDTLERRLCNTQRIDYRIIKTLSHSCGGTSDKRHIKLCVMCADRRIAAESHKVADRNILGRSVGYHIVRDTRKLRDI